MPSHTSFPVADFAPKAWSAICELLGGEDRIAPSTDSNCVRWNDGFIVNLGREEYDPAGEVEFRDLDNWHTDGDFFVHFLDSPEQALLVIPLFSDIEPKGGGTVVCSDGIGIVARYLYDHSQGVTPHMKPLSEPDSWHSQNLSPWRSIRDSSATRSSSFHEITGEVGDVFLLHPLMLHSASRNLLRRVRIITNPPVSLKEPFTLNRGPSDRPYSLVEQKTLREVGRLEGLGDWEIGGKREEWVPDRIRIQAEMKMREMERLKALENIG